MTTQTTTNANKTLQVSVFPSPWQGTRGAGLGDLTREPPRWWLQLVRAQKIGLAGQSVQGMTDMTMLVASNKGRAG
jgi:hypothetical protein